MLGADSSPPDIAPPQSPPSPPVTGRAIPPDFFVDPDDPLATQPPVEPAPATPPGHPAFRSRAWGLVLPLALTLLAYQLYLPHLCPVLFVGDSGELITAATTRGIAHPPGYPLYTLLLNGWLQLPWRSPGTWHTALFGMAYGANAFSAFCAALSVGGVALLVWNITRHGGWAAVAGLIWLATPTLFSQALVAEVYALQALLVVLLLLCWFKLLTGPSPAWLLGLALVQGLALAHHPASVLLLPVSGLVAYVHGRTVRYASMAPWYGAIAAFAIGVGFYLYLPMRSLQNPWLDWGNPEDWNRFWAVVTRSDYRQIKASIADEAPLGIGGIIVAWWEWTVAQYQMLLVPIVVGIIFCWIRGGRWVVVLTLALLLATVPYWWYFRNIGPDDLNFLEVYFIPAHLLLLAMGITGLAPNPRGPKLALQSWQGAVVALLVLGLVGKQWGLIAPQLSRQDSQIGSRFAASTLLSIPDHSILICEGDEIFLYWYLQAVAGLKPDVAILESDILLDTGTWYWADLRRRHTDLQYPATPSRGEMLKEGYDTKAKIQAHMTRELLRRNPDREVFLTGLGFNPANKTDIGVAPAGILHQLKRGSDFAIDPAEAFFEQGLEPSELGWLITQEEFDFYEIVLHEKYVRAIASYAERALAAGQVELGERLFRLSAQLEPARWDLLRGLAITLMDQERWAESRNIFKHLAEHDPNDPLYAFGLAVSHYHLGEMEQWRLEVARAHALDPDNKFLELEAETIGGMRQSQEMIDLFTAPDAGSNEEE